MLPPLPGKAKASVRVDKVETVPPAPMGTSPALRGASSSPSAHRGHVPRGSPWSPSRLARPLPPANRTTDQHGAGGESWATAQPWHGRNGLQGQLWQLSLPGCQAPCQGVHKHQHTDATMSRSLCGLVPNSAPPGPAQASPAPYLLSRHALLPLVPLVPFHALQATLSLQRGKHREGLGMGRYMAEGQTPPGQGHRGL